MDVFANNVLQQMEDLGLSMTELAKRSGKDRSTLHKTLNGQGGSFNLATCDAIAEALGTDALNLFRPK